MRDVIATLRANEEDYTKHNFPWCHYLGKVESEENEAAIVYIGMDLRSEWMILEELTV